MNTPLFSFLPKYGSGEIVRILKSRSARRPCAGEFWSDGYFVRTVGDEVTTEVIKRYIEYHNSQQLAFVFSF